MTPSRFNSRVWYSSERRMVYYADSLLQVQDEEDIRMQSTGLVDVDGKEIFEGDVVEDETMGEPHRYVIRWLDEDASFCGGMRDTSRNIKVIGNIYENPGSEK